MAEIVVEAKQENLDRVLEFVNTHLEQAGCKKEAQLQIDIATEEIFVNIASYAYETKLGEAIVKLEVSEEPLQTIIQFIDHGKPYNPLKREDPDITLSCEEREIGGLGIYLVKQSMDQVAYHYDGTKNILTIRKKI